jgi:hypothetical protein
MNATMTQWENALIRFAGQLFSGEDEGNALLTKFMAEGALIDGGVPIGTDQPKIMDVGEMKNMAKRALFTYMIPVAWMNNKDANVAILETDNACRDFTGLTENQNVPRQEVAETVEFCWDNKQYLLLAAIGPFQTCQQNGPAPLPFCTRNLWSLPPGLEKLPDFGITHRDIMEG